MAHQSINQHRVSATGHGVFETSASQGVKPISFEKPRIPTISKLIFQHLEILKFREDRSCRMAVERITNTF